MTWDVARIWGALDKVYARVRPAMTTTTYSNLKMENPRDTPRPAEQAGPNFRPNGGPDSNRQVLEHLQWMFEQTKKHAATGKHQEKALIWLGFIQGVTWALGLASVNELRAANFDDTKRSGYKVDDIVVCIGEGTTTLFRVAKVSEGHEEGTGSAYLLHHPDYDRGHGWEDFRKLRLAQGSQL